jgi:uncharacterized protein (DUF1697 family)
MAELRQVFEDAGCEAVRTYIQSGNVVFEHATPKRATLEAAVADAFGLQIAIVLRTAKQIRDLAHAHPFGADTSKSHVAFLAKKPNRAALLELSELDVAPDRLEIAGPDIVLHYPNGFSGARLTAARLEKHLGVPATFRNWRTVARVAELAN